MDTGKPQMNGAHKLFDKFSDEKLRCITTLELQLGEVKISNSYTLRYAVKGYAKKLKKGTADFYCMDPSLGVFAISDGLEREGHLASQLITTLTVEKLSKFLQKPPIKENQKDIPNGRKMKSIVQTIHNLFLNYRKPRNPDGTGDRGDTSFGATLDLGLIQDDHLKFCHVGDGRIYIATNLGEVEKLTRDHNGAYSYGEEPSSHICQSENEKRLNPRQNDLKNYVGIHEYFNDRISNYVTATRLKIDSVSRSLHNVQRILFTTDGLIKVATEEEIADILRSGKDPEDIIQSYMQLWEKPRGILRYVWLKEGQKREDQLTKFQEKLSRCDDITLIVIELSKRYGICQDSLNSQYRTDEDETAIEIYLNGHQPNGLLGGTAEQKKYEENRHETQGENATALTVQLGQTQEELKQLKETYTKEKTELEEKLKRAESTAQEREQITLSTQKRLEELTSIYAKAQQETKQFKEEYDRTQQQLKVNETQYSTEIARLQGALADAQNTHAGAEASAASYKELETKVQKFQEENSTLKKTLAAAAGVAAVASVVSVVKGITDATKTKEYQTLERSLQEEQRARSETEARVAGLETGLKAAQQETGDLRSGKLQAEKDYITLKEKSGVLEATATKLQEEKHSLEERLKTAEQQATAGTATHDTVQREYDQAKNAWNQERGQLTEKNIALQKEKSALEAKIAGLTTAIQTQEQYAQEKVALTEQVAKYQREAETKTNEARTATERADGLKKTLQGQKKPARIWKKAISYALAGFLGLGIGAIWWDRDYRGQHQSQAPIVTEVARQHQAPPLTQEQIKEHAVGIRDMSLMSGEANEAKRESRHPNPKPTSFDYFLTQGVVREGDGKGIALTWSRDKQEWKSISAAVGTAKQGAWTIEAAVQENTASFELPKEHDYRLLIPNGSILPGGKQGYDVLYARGGEKVTLPLSTWQQEQVESNKLPLQYESVEYRGRENNKHQFYVKASGKNVEVRKANSHTTDAQGKRTAMGKEQENIDITSQSRTQHPSYQPETQVASLMQLTDSDNGNKYFVDKRNIADYVEKKMYVTKVKLPWSSGDNLTSKSSGIDRASLLHQAQQNPATGRYCTTTPAELTTLTGRLKEYVTELCPVEDQNRYQYLIKEIEKITLGRGMIPAPGNSLKLVA